MRLAKGPAAGGGACNGTRFRSYESGRGKTGKGWTFLMERKGPPFFVRNDHPQRAVGRSSAPIIFQYVLHAPRDMLLHGSAGGFRLPVADGLKDRDMLESGIFIVLGDLGYGMTGAGTVPQFQ